MKNTLRKKLEQGKKVFGTFAELGGTNSVEAMGQAGLDYIVIDSEHGSFETESMADMIRACELAGITPLCRVRELTRPAIMKLLDVGAGGLVIPDIESVEQIYQILEYSKYAPMGKRGYCGSRKDGWGYAFPDMSVADQMAYWNKETMIIPQCETVECLEHIEEITAIDGVDGIDIGPFDLSISMGIPGQFDNPEFVAAIDRILHACKKNGKYAMAFTTQESKINEYYDQGFEMVAYAMDATVFIDAFKRLVNNIK